MLFILWKSVTIVVNNFMRRLLSEGYNHSMTVAKFKTLLRANVIVSVNENQGFALSPFSQLKS